VFTEATPGYGVCCMRALAEAAQGADVIVLCEGDLTFTARDVKKLLAYLENCDLVLGTRTTQELREPATQMDWLINRRQPDRRQADPGPLLGHAVDRRGLHLGPRSRAHARPHLHGLGWIRGCPFVGGPGKALFSSPRTCA
jgi:hypothetical protein